MSNTEVIPALGTQDIDVISQAAKLATLLALSTFQSGEYTGTSGLSARLGELQGPVPAMEFTHARVASYCATAFAPARFIEFAGAEKRDKPKSPLSVRLNSRGRTFGMAAAGALLPLEFDAPEKSFLRRTIGVKQEYKESPLPPLYEQLLARPQGAAELQQETGLGYRAILGNIKRLCDLKVLTSINTDDPANRRYRIADKPYRLRSDTGPLSRAVISAAIALRDEGSYEVSGAEVLARAQALVPRASEKEMNRAFVLWTTLSAKRNSQFIMPLGDEAGDTKGSPRKHKVRITDAYQPHIKKLLEIRRLLTDTSSEGIDFRDESQRHAQEMADSPELMAALMSSEAQSPLRALSKDDWRQQAEKLIPESGNMELKDLYNRATQTLGRHVSYRYFTVCLEGSKNLEVTPQPTGPKELMQKHVRRKLHTFYSDWADDAACRFEDPELFFPPSLSGPSIKQAAKAKAMCEACPVRLACLKVALDNKVTHGIQGGVWLEKPGESTPELTTYIKENVRIVKA